MIRWEVFIIPLIALGVWILGTIFRNAEEERQKLGARRPPGGGRGPNQRPTTDLERFLEEARRRREQLEKREPAEQKERPPQERPPVSKTPRPRRETPGPERRSPRPREVVAVPVAQPAAKPLRVMPDGMERVPAKASFPPPPAPVVVAPSRVLAEAVVVQAMPTPLAIAEVVVIPAAPTVTRDRAALTSRAQILNLLRNPSTRAAAFVLNEVLGPPLCRRRR